MKNVLMNPASIPGGISTCTEEELIFISDSLHDRIIITDRSGGVLDYVGLALRIPIYDWLNFCRCTQLSSTHPSRRCCVIVAQLY